MRLLKLLLLFPMLVLGPFAVRAQISGHQDWQKLPLRCASCHTGHGVAGTAMLPLAEEDFCFQCHGDFNEFEKAVRENRILPSLKMKNMRKVFKKPFRHPVELKSNGGGNQPEQTVFGATRSECTDCHRGHGISQLESFSGITANRSTKNEKELEYQLCYACHARIIQTSLAERDISDWFDPGNPSFHPVETTGKNGEVPSLKRPYTEGSIINCTDCHNNNDSSGPRGPHGSDFKFILESNYSLDDYQPESEEQYRLCYKCHDRESILANESFPLHRQHVIDGPTSCFTCHSSHGSRLNTHLIKFAESGDTFTIQPSSSGRLEFVDRGLTAGICYLSCHGVDHDPKSYSNFSELAERITEPFKPVGGNRSWAGYNLSINFTT